MVSGLMNLNDWTPFAGTAALFGAVYAYYTLRTGVPTFPSMPAARDKITELLKADQAKAQDNKPYKIYDLGSGSGQLSWHIARAMPNAEVVGIELSLFPWLRATAWQKLTRQKNLRYLRADFIKHPIKDADAVLMYLMEAVMQKVGFKLQNELKPGALVLSNKYALPGWQAKETFPLPFTKRLLVYRQADEDAGVAPGTPLIMQRTGTQG
jgi:SAM-dependent methyltransferase